MPDAEFARRRSAELARIHAARAHDTGAQGWRQPMIRPACGAMSGRFGAQRVFRGVPAAYHAGMDIAAGAGSAIVAPADGVVVLAAVADVFTLEGHLVIVDHGMGLNSALLHARTLSVGEGTAVKQGQVLGEVGMTGRATGPHLHWGLTWRGRRLDPLLLIQAG
jgi:murein DD-endopeptidase MepM/ murein hydrolase activator NlpD